MDRFIDISNAVGDCYVCNLKSNMDRFIELLQQVYEREQLYLKSNMDRFIGTLFSAFVAVV